MAMDPAVFPDPRLSHGATHLLCVGRRSEWLFFFNDAAPTAIYPLSLHDALPIWAERRRRRLARVDRRHAAVGGTVDDHEAAAADPARERLDHAQDRRRRHGS